jgi:diguanylate cyclase
MRSSLLRRTVVLPWLHLLLGWMLLCMSCAAPAAPSAVALHAGTDRVALAGHYEIFEDPSRTLTATQVDDSTYGWTTQRHVLNLGHSTSAWWLRLKMTNPQGVPVTRILDLQNPRLDDIEFTLVRQGQARQTVHTGDRLPYATRALPYHGFAFPITLAPGESAQVLIRLDSHDGYFGLLPMALLSEPEFQQDIQRHTLLCGLYYGGLLILLLYHLCLLGSTRDAAFAWYVGYLGSLVATRFAMEGHASQYLTALPPDWVNQGLLLCYSMSVVLFGFMLLANLKTLLAQRRWLLWSCWAVLALNAVPLPMALMGSYSGTLKIAMPATMLSIAFVMGVSVWAWRVGMRHTRYFLAGGTCMLLGLLAERLWLESALPAHPLMAYGVAIGSVLEALFIAIALAEGMNRMKAEKLRAERDAREAQSLLNDELGRLVQERTLELESANQRLTTLSITDELTGAYNRRHFQEQLTERIAQARRSDDAIGLCLFDLDHFKGYNDRYGHPAGDEVLRRVSATVSKHLKRSVDRLYRVGGEEFALLISSADHTLGDRFIEELRGAIQALALPHEKNETGVVTASFGLAWCSNVARAQIDAESLYRAADEMLYQAKALGRNRVESNEVAPRQANARRA